MEMEKAGAALAAKKKGSWAKVKEVKSTATTHLP